jgi:hypothetical protein
VQEREREADEAATDASADEGESGLAGCQGVVVLSCVFAVAGFVGTLQRNLRQKRLAQAFLCNLRHAM